MWYAILLGAGLLVGLAMMIWALRERKARFTAEAVLKDVQVERDKFSAIADANREAAVRAAQDTAKCKETSALLYAELDKARDLLVKFGDTEAIREWLLSEINKPL